MVIFFGPLSAASFATSFPIRVLPVKVTFFVHGCLISASDKLGVFSKLLHAR